MTEAQASRGWTSQGASQARDSAFLHDKETTEEGAPLGKLLQIVTSSKRSEKLISSKNANMRIKYNIRLVQIINTDDRSILKRHTRADIPTAILISKQIR